MKARVASLHVSPRPAARTRPGPPACRQSHASGLRRRPARRVAARADFNDNHGVEGREGAVLDKGEARPCMRHRGCAPCCARAPAGRLATARMGSRRFPAPVSPLSRPAGPRVLLSGARAPSSIRTSAPASQALVRPARRSRGPPAASAAVSDDVTLYFVHGCARSRPWRPDCGPPPPPGNGASPARQCSPRRDCPGPRPHKRRHLVFRAHLLRRRFRAIGVPRPPLRGGKVSPVGCIRDAFPRRARRSGMRFLVPLFSSVTDSAIGAWEIPRRGPGRTVGLKLPRMPLWALRPRRAVPTRRPLRPFARLSCFQSPPRRSLSYRSPARAPAAPPLPPCNRRPSPSAIPQAVPRAAPPTKG